MRSAMAAATARHHAMFDQPDPPARLRLQHAHEVRVGHGRQGVVAHAAVAEQQVADKQMALEHRTLVVGEGGCDGHEVATSASIKASVTGPMLPCGVESNVEQTLK